MEYTFAGLPLPLRIKPPYPLTDDQLLRLSAKHKPVPIERDAEGYLLFMTPAGSITSHKNVYISRMLDQWAEDDGRGLAFDSNGGFTLPDGSMRAPDGAWIPLEKWDTLSHEQQTRYAPICPDFIIELRSESDSLSDLSRKMESWLINGTNSPGSSTLSKKQSPSTARAAHRKSSQPSPKSPEKAPSPASSSLSTASSANPPHSKWLVVSIGRPSSKGQTAGKA